MVIIQTDRAHACKVDRQNLPLLNLIQYSQYLMHVHVSKPTVPLQEDL